MIEFRAKWEHIFLSSTNVLGLETTILYSGKIRLNKRQNSLSQQSEDGLFCGEGSHLVVLRGYS